MNGRFAAAVAVVSGVGLVGVLLLGTASSNDSTVLAVSGVAALVLAALGLLTLGRAVVVSERDRRPR